MSRNDDQDTPYLSTDDTLSDDPYGFDQESSFHANYGDDEDSGITIIDPARRQRRTLTRALIAICVMVVLALLLWLFGTGDSPEPERTAGAPPAPNEPTLILPPLPPLAPQDESNVAAPDGELALPTDTAMTNAPEEPVTDLAAASEPEAPLPPAPQAAPEPVVVAEAPQPVAEPAAPPAFAQPAPAPEPAPAPAPVAVPAPEPAPAPAPVVAPAPAPSPAPAPAPAAAKTPEKAPAAQPAVSAPVKAEPATAPAPSKEGGRYAVRIGEFMPLEQAQNLLKDVLTQKESASIQQRITVGSFPDRAAARAEQARLAQSGHADSVVVRGDNGGFTVQLGVFSRASNAERLVQQLRTAGFAVNSAARVTVGPYASRAEAEQALAKIRQKNSVSGQIISAR